MMRTIIIHELDNGFMVQEDLGWEDKDFAQKFVVQEPEEEGFEYDHSYYEQSAQANLFWKLQEMIHPPSKHNLYNCRVTFEKNKEKLEELKESRNI